MAVETLKLQRSTINQKLKLFFLWRTRTDRRRTSVTSSLALKALNAAVWEALGHAHPRLICISGGKLWLFVAVSPAKATPTGTPYRGKTLAPASKPPTMEKPRHTHTHRYSPTLFVSNAGHCSAHTHTRTRHSGHIVGPWWAGTPISCLTLKVKISETNRWAME